MNRIQIKNFRRFTENEVYKIPFKDITILVGKNNSGKSTMVKALLLVLEFLKSDSTKNFDFANKNLENANIVTFGRAKNKYAKSDVISLAITLKEFTIAIELTGDEDDTSAQVISAIINVHEPEMISTGHTHQFEVYPISNKVIISRSKSNPFAMFGGKPDAQKNNEVEKIESQIQQIKNELLQLEKTSREFIEKNQIINKLEDKRKILLKSSKSSTQKEQYTLELDYPKDKSLKDILENVSEDAALMSFERFKKNSGLKANQAKEPYANFIAFNEYYKKVEAIIKYIFDTVEKMSLYYLPSNPAKQSALFRIKDKQNPLAQSIHEFYQITKRSKEGEAHRFVKKWMSNEGGFEIGDDFVITQQANEAYEVNIIENEKSVPLADKGMGSIQAMLLIFRIAVIIEKIKIKQDNPMVIIEEPELNLHPALQSRLCDFFLEVYDEYNICFIIESHSEYLIRKSQVFVKEREYEHETNNNPFSVIYFDKFWDRIYSMRYRKDGRFENDFGNGFYDEAANLTFDLL